MTTENALELQRRTQDMKELKLQMKMFEAGLITKEEFVAKKLEIETARKERMKEVGTSRKALGSVDLNLDGDVGDSSSSTTNSSSSDSDED